MSLLPFLLSFMAVLNSQRPIDDLITNLPSLNFSTNYSQYSGFLDLNNSHHYHYWLTESQSNPDHDPLVLWLNGGPGCSSLYGMLYENGPIHIDIKGKLYDNKQFGWNQNANIIYLESPICVGYSYMDNTKHCNMNDTTTADDNYHAMLRFLDKFPVYADTDFFVVGESYGGVYSPTLTLRILQGNANQDGEHNPMINIKGFSVGNGISKRFDVENSRRWFQYHHGMISEKVWNNMLTNCCSPPFDRNSCDFISSSSTNASCHAALNEAQKHCCDDINPYNILDPCIYATKMLKQEVEFNKFDDLRIDTNMSCDLEGWGGNVYLNRPDVRKAIHIPAVLDNLMWDQCAALGRKLNYTQIWPVDLNPVYDEIFELDDRIMMTMYNGDLDMVCNFLGDEWFLDDMNLTVTNEWREWYVTDNNGKQVGGWTKDWDRGNGIHFVTVRGSGHMVPLYRPQAALKLFQYFIQNKQLD